jgi:hypothetical protein
MIPNFQLKTVSASGGKLSYEVGTTREPLTVSPELCASNPATSTPTV